MKFFTEDRYFVMRQIIAWMVVALAFVYLLFSSTADAATCFADRYGVYRHTPGSWAGWTRQMPGHVGDKCYYPMTKGRRHDRNHSNLPAMVTVSPYDLDDAVSRQQTSKRLAGRIRQSVIMADMDHHHRKLGATTHEFRTMDRVRTKSLEMVKPITTAVSDSCHRYCERLLKDFDTWLYIRKTTTGESK